MWIHGRGPTGGLRIKEGEKVNLGAHLWLTDMPCRRDGKAFCPRLKLRHPQHGGAMCHLPKALVSLAQATQTAQVLPCAPCRKVIPKQGGDLGHCQGYKQQPH